MSKGRTTTDKPDPVEAGRELRVALNLLLERYTGLVNSGDAGNWDPEDEDEVKKARVAIKKAKEAGL